MSKISWLQLLDLVDEQMKELNRNKLNVSESNINNITPDLHISDEELIEALDKYSEMSDLEKLFENKGQSKAEKLVLSLPKFVPNEQWGNSKTEARKEIKKFIRNIGGRTVAERLSFLMKIQVPNNNITATRRIISSIILLESLRSMLEAYSASGAGYVFEGFVAALMNGEQVTDPPEGSLPIEDVMAFTYEGQRPGLPLSLKLLRAKGETKGSFKNLVDALYARDSKGMGYIVVFKEGEEAMDLTIKEFTFTNKNMVPILAEGAGVNVKLFKPNKVLMKQIANSSSSARLVSKAKYFATKGTAREVMQAYQELTPEEYYLLLQATEGYSHERLDEGGSNTQFYIRETFFRRYSEGVIEHGTLSVSPQAIVRTAEMYMSILNEAITALFSAVSDLSTNINEYFTSADREKAIQNGNDAKNNTIKIRKSLDKQMKEK